MTATATQVANANGAPAEKIVDVATGSPETSPATAATADPPKQVEAAADKAEAPAQVAAPQVDPLAAARAAVRRRHQNFHERQALQNESARRAQEAEHFRQLALREQQRAQEYERQITSISRDPMAALAHLEKVGLDAKTLTQKAVESTTPEAKLRAELEAKMEARLAEVEQQYNARILEIQQRDAEARNAQLASAARARFVSEAADAARFPAVAAVVAKGDEWKASILSEAQRVLQDAFNKTGQHYTNEEVLHFLNQKYAKILSPDPKDGATKSNAEATGTVAGTGSKEVAASGSRTLTNEASQVKGTLPPNFDDLSKADQNKALAAMYRQLART